MQLKGTQWGRPRYEVGLAAVVNRVSSAHEAFLNDGRLGIPFGDGRLPHVEACYAFVVLAMTATLDYQFAVNPAYNRDRGTVSVIGTRLHCKF